MGGQYLLDFWRKQTKRLPYSSVPECQVVLNLSTMFEEKRPTILPLLDTYKHTRNVSLEIFSKKRKKSSVIRWRSNITQVFCYRGLSSKPIKPPFPSSLERGTTHCLQHVVIASLVDKSQQQAPRDSHHEHCSGSG